MSSAPSTTWLGAKIPISCVRPDGLIVFDDGLLARVVRLDTAITPLRMSDSELERTNKAIQEIPSLLPDHQGLQLTTTARPYDWVPDIDTLEQETKALADALIAEGLPDRAEALTRLAVADGDALIRQATQLSAMQLEHLLVLPWRGTKAFLRPRHFTPEYFNEVVEDLDAQHSHIVTHLDTLNLAPHRMTGHEVLQSLYRTLNPGDTPPAVLAELVSEPVADIEEATESAEMLRGALCRTNVDDSARTHLNAAGHVIQSRTLSSTPDHTWLGWLMHLCQSPYPFSLSVRWEAGGRARERVNARRRYRRIFAMQRGREIKGRPVDFEERQREQEAANLTAELATSAGAGVYRASINLSISSPPDPRLLDATQEILDEDFAARAKRLERYTRNLEQEIVSRTDARLHLTRFEQINGWAATWPLGLDPLGIKRRYVTQNLADTIPVVSAHCGSPSGIRLGWERPGRTMAKLDPFDPWHDNHIMPVCARSGAGKTMVTNMILGRILRLGATGGIIDRAGHYETLASLIPGAAALNLGSNPGFDHDKQRKNDPWRMRPHQRPPAVNPWDVENARELPTEKLQYLLALHSFFVGEQGADGTYDLTPGDASLLSRAIRRVYRQCADYGEQPRELVLQNILKIEADEAMTDGNPERAANCRRLADALYDYVGEGSRAYLADWPTTVPDDSPLVIFDTRNVGDADAGAAMFTIVEFLARRGERARATFAHRGPWGGRTFLVIDEGWKLLERKSTGRWINELGRRSRHHRLFLVPITQQMSDFTKHPEGAALISQSSMQLILRQHPEQAELIQKTLNLTDMEKDTIAGLKTVKGQYSEAYFINGRRGRGLIEIRAGNVEYWYSTSEPDHDQPLRTRVMAEHPDDPWAGIVDLADNYAPLTA